MTSSVGAAFTFSADEVGLRYFVQKESPSLLFFTVQQANSTTITVHQATIALTITKSQILCRSGI